MKQSDLRELAQQIGYDLLEQLEFSQVFEYAESHGYDVPTEEDAEKVLELVLKADISL